MFLETLVPSWGVVRAELPNPIQEFGLSTLAVARVQHSMTAVGAADVQEMNYQPKVQQHCLNLAVGVY